MIPILEALAGRIGREVADDFSHREVDEDGLRLRFLADIEIVQPTT